MVSPDPGFYVSFLRHGLQSELQSENTNSTLRALQMLLRVDDYRLAFVQRGGLEAIMSSFNGKINFQLQYQLVCAIWCLTFNAEIARKARSLGVIQTLAGILNEATKEKVIRVIVATFRNILEKAGENGQCQAVREVALQMVQCKALKTMELLAARKFEDPDLRDDVDYLNASLHHSVQDLSSFDEYFREVKSGQLYWSPVHKSEKFWRENAERFHDKRWDIVKALVQLLETASDPLVLCVAAHDLGEYVRHYPRGKNFVEQNHGKTAVMKLLSAEDPNVRYHALIAVQQLMVHNWDYLDQQLRPETLIKTR